MTILGGRFTSWKDFMSNEETEVQTSVKFDPRTGTGGFEMWVPIKT